MTIERFAHDLVQEVIAAAEADGTSTHDAFAAQVLSELESAGHIEDFYVTYFRAHGVEVSGYGVDEGREALELSLV